LRKLRAVQHNDHALAQEAANRLDRWLSVRVNDQHRRAASSHHRVRGARRERVVQHRVRTRGHDDQLVAVTRQLADDGALKHDC
jgi:hypothetical protein